MERGYWRESACATKSGSRARYQHTFQRKRIQNGLSNAAYAVEFQESGPNFRHADKGQTIPLLDLVAGRPVVESIAQRNGRLARLPSGPMEMAATLRTDENSIFEGFDAFLLPQSTSHWLPDLFLNTPPPSGARTKYKSHQIQLGKTKGDHLS